MHYCSSRIDRQAGYAWPSQDVPGRAARAQRAAAAGARWPAAAARAAASAAAAAPTAPRCPRARAHAPGNLLLLADPPRSRTRLHIYVYVCISSADLSNHYCNAFMMLTMSSLLCSTS